MKLTFFIIVVSSARLLLFVAIAQSLNGANILFDISQIANDAIQPGSDQAYAALDLLIKKSNFTSLLYYKADFYQDITNEIQDVLALLRRKTSENFQHRVIFSIKDVHGLRGQQNISLFYNKLLDLLSNDTAVFGVAYHAYWLDSLCGANNENFNSSHPTASIISDMRRHISETNKKKKLKSKLKLGYELHVNYLKCKDHQLNKQQADFLIVNVPISRNDDRFAESYGLFKSLLDNEIMPVIFETSGSTWLLTKVSLTQAGSREPCIAFYRSGLYSGEKIYYPYQLELLNFAKERLKKSEESFSARYEHLINQYMHQWICENKHHNYSTILTSTVGFLNLDISEFNKNLFKNKHVIPFVSLPSNSQTPDQTYVSACNVFLKDVKENGFTNIVISAETWQLRRKTNDSKSVDHKTNTSEPIDVFYYLENVAEFNRIRNNPGTIHGSAEVNDEFIVLSSKIKLENKKKWEEVLWNVLGSKQIATLACQISTDNLQILGAHDKCENPICCEAILVRTETINRCRHVSSKSNTAIWFKTFNFTELEQNQYRLEYFVNSTVKMLDSFLIAREIVWKDYPKQNIIIHLKSFYSGNLSWSGGTTLYCNSYAERIGQLYETILTWAQIHDFELILEPSGEKYRYDHPLVWKQLEVSASNNMYELMNKFPVYFRRNHITSKIFGNWNHGMYPCIQRTTMEHTKKIKTKDFYNAGVTLRMDFRQMNNHLTANEFQVMLLFSLYKFSDVEIQITQPEHLTILKSVVQIPEFKKNIRLNQIIGRTVQLQLADILCTQTDNEVISALNEAGLKVQISAETFKCLHDVKSELYEVGLVIRNCSREAQSVVQSPTLHKGETKWSQVAYIVCVTDKVLAHNRVEKEMQDYLDSHLYLKKLFQYFYPNLKQVYFRLQPWQVQEIYTISDLLMFLTDVNNYAIGYEMKYFLIQAFASENNKMQSSFWKVTDYSNLSDVNVFRDQVTLYLKQPTEVPNILTGNDDNIDIKSSTYRTVEPSEETNTRSSVNPQNTAQNVAGGIGATAIFIILIVAVYLLWRRTRRLTSKEIHQFRYGRQETLRKAVKERRGNQYTVNIYDGLVFQKDFEIPKKYISINRKIVLGKGKFTIVHPATLSNLDGCVVCIKIANIKCSKQAFKGMMSELKLLSYLGDHMNLVRFIGCYTKDVGKGVLWIVTEFCDGGSLHAYLKTKIDADISELIRFSYGVAKGMEYISNQKVINGNLRTARIFLDGTKTCKISGFGRLASKMDDLKKQMKKNKAPKEWQWMAYESLKAGEFSIESDIWSFGVTIWEIFSLGCDPHENLPWDNFTGSTETGLRLKMPQLASNEIHDLMTKCWSLNPKDRPDFPSLVGFFGNLLGKTKP